MDTIKISSVLWPWPNMNLASTCSGRVFIMSSASVNVHVTVRWACFVIVSKSSCCLKSVVIVARISKHCHERKRLFHKRQTITCTSLPPSFLSPIQIVCAKLVMFYFVAVNIAYRTFLEFTSIFQCLHLNLCIPLLCAQTSPSDTNFI